MKNEVHVSFCIWDFDDITHDGISDLLKVMPSKVHIKGEKKNPKFNQLASSNGWFLDSPLGIYCEFDEQLDSLLNLMNHNLEGFQTICKKYYCEISVAIYMYFDNGESTPSMHLTKDQIHRLNLLNLEVDFDLYTLPNS